MIEPVNWCWTRGVIRRLTQSVLYTAARLITDRVRRYSTSHRHCDCNRHCSLAADKIPCSWGATGENRLENCTDDVRLFSRPKYEVYPKYFGYLCIPVHTVATRSRLQSVGHGDLVVPRVWSTRFGCCSFRVCRPTIRNNLPQDLRSTDTRNSLRLKNWFFFDCAYTARGASDKPQPKARRINGLTYLLTYLLNALICESTTWAWGGKRGVGQVSVGTLPLCLPPIPM